MEIIGCLFIKRILFAFDWLSKRCKEISCKFHCTNLDGTKKGFTTQFPHRALPLKAFFAFIYQHKNWSQISRLQTCQCIRYEPYFPRHHAHLHKTLLPINLTLFRGFFLSSVGLEAKNLIFEVYASAFFSSFCFYLSSFFLFSCASKWKSFSTSSTAIMKSLQSCFLSLASGMLRHFLLLLFDEALKLSRNGELFLCLLCVNIALWFTIYLFDLKAKINGKQDAFRLEAKSTHSDEKSQKSPVWEAFLQHESRRQTESLAGRMGRRCLGKFSFFFDNFLLRFPLLRTKTNKTTSIFHEIFSSAGE